MKKILIIGMYNQLGGIESFIMNFYKNLYNKFEFGFICMHKNIAYEQDIVKLNGKIHKVTNVKKNPLKCKKEIKNIIEKEKYDVIHINMLSAANIIPLKAAKAAKAKTIIAHVHNNGMPNEILRKTMHYINKRKINKYASTLLACSNEAGKWMFGMSKFTVINNAIDVTKFKYNEKEAHRLKEKYNIQNKIIYGHVGRFEKQKNHLYLIDVFNEILKTQKNAVLILIGSGTLKNKILAKTKKLNIQKNVIIIDETKEVYKYYWMMDFFIFPSLYEGLGIVTIEAQAAGLQCFVSENIPKNINIDNSVLFIPINQNPKLFAQAILKKQTKINKISLYNSVLQSKYNIKNEIKILEKIYKSGD